MAKRSRKKRTSLRVGVGGVSMRVAGGIRAVEAVSEQPVGRTGNWPWWGCVAAAVAAMFALVCVSVGGLAGDTVIHLIFAEHALQGRWFEFNAGVPSGGESSPLYMLYVTGLYWLFGPLEVPYVLQWMGAVAWATLLVGLWRAARLLGADRGWALALVVAIGLMPGSARNAVLGMENVYFAAGLVWLLVYTLRAGWFDRPLKWWREIFVALVLGVLSCLRPEGVVVTAVLMSARAYMLRGSGVAARYVVAAMVAAALFAVQTYVYWRITGTFPFGGGMARQTLAGAKSVEVLGVAVNCKILGRWLIYAPLALLVAFGVRGLVKLPWSLGRDAWVPLAHRRMAWSLLCVVLVLTVLFMTLFGSGHLGRYTMFYWPIALLAGWVGAGPMLKRLWQEGGMERVLVGGAMVSLLLVYVIEAGVRVRTLGPGHPLAEVAMAPLLRASTTDALLEQLEATTATAKKPVVAGIVEVQMRYWWDDRVFVTSLDGIVDRRLLKYVKHGYYDHLGYAKEAGITHFLELPNFNRDARDFALADLAKLAPGDVMARDGLKLERLAGGAVRVGR